MTAAPGAFVAPEPITWRYRTEGGHPLTLTLEDIAGQWAGSIARGDITPDDPAPASEGEEAAAAPELPPVDAPRPVWDAYAAARHMDEATAKSMSRADLHAHFLAADAAS